MMSRAQLCRWLAYDPITGIFIWRIDSAKNVKSGNIAGGIKPNGYQYIAINHTSYLAHRLAWFYETGLWPVAEIDHINTIRSDNRICNLRESTCVENKRNASKRSDNVSGQKGVSWDKKNSKWQVHIKLNRKSIYLGRFDDIIAASDAYADAANRYFGAFARLA